MDVQAIGYSVSSEEAVIQDDKSTGMCVCVYICTFKSILLYVYVHVYVHMQAYAVMSHNCLYMCVDMDT